MGTEKPASYYDHKMMIAAHRLGHYSESPYFPLWLVVADRLRTLSPERIIDLGCGTGQFAELLSDQGIASYLGLDFSGNCIIAARRAAPKLQFAQVDLNESKSLLDETYDCVVALEFLEHVENDLGILRQVKPGTHVIASVPNFPTPAHVRHFDTVSDVRNRYQSVLQDLDIFAYKASAKGRTFYILQGKRTADDRKLSYCE